MDRKVVLTSVVIVVIVVLAGAWAMWPKAQEKNDRIYQVGTLDGLLNGEYDGKITVSSLLSQGSMGLGTFQGLDGEMIVLDGKCYQASVDGTVEEVAGSMKTPFASVTDLMVDINAPIHNVNNYTVLQSQILDALGAGSGFALIVIHGNFTHLTVRSVPGQVEPYPPLPAVVQNQTKFELSGVTGTLVGFYSPAYIGTVDQAGFHMHFLSDDHESGGHVLDAEMTDVIAQLDIKTGLVLDL